MPSREQPPSAKRTRELDKFRKWIEKNAAATPVRQDVSDMMAACRITFGVEFGAVHHPLLAELLDQYSSRSVMVAISVLHDNAILDGLDFFELFQAQIWRALYFLSLVPISEWRDLDILERWRRFSLQISVEEDLARFWPESELQKEARERFSKLTASDVRWVQ